MAHLVQLVSRTDNDGIDQMGMCRSPGGFALADQAAKEVGSPLD